jgi:hypothetical protein
MPEIEVPLGTGRFPIRFKKPQKTTIVLRE